VEHEPRLLVRVRTTRGLLRMTTFDLTPDGNAVTAPPRPVADRVTRTAALTSPRARRRTFRGHSLWLQAVVFAVALGAGLFTGYLINH